MPDQLPEPILGPIDGQVLGPTSSPAPSPTPSAIEAHSPALRLHAKPVELAAWIAPSRVYDPKSPMWFLGLFAIGLVGILIFAILRDLWLILVTGAFIFVYYALARVQPAEVEHRILSTGVQSGGRMYDWKDLKSFWVTPGTSRVLRLDTAMFFPHMLELLLPEEAELPTRQVESWLLAHLAQREKPASETGAMADTAIVSAAQIIPYKGKVLSWLSQRLDL